MPSVLTIRTPDFPTIRTSDFVEVSLHDVPRNRKLAAARAAEAAVDSFREEIPVLGYTRSTAKNYLLSLPMNQRKILRVCAAAPDGVCTRDQAYEIMGRPLTMTLKGITKPYRRILETQQLAGVLPPEAIVPIDAAYPPVAGRQRASGFKLAEELIPVFRHM